MRIREFKKLLLSTAVLFFASCASAQHLEHEDGLQGDGMAAEIHGAPQDLGHFVASVQDPENPIKFTYYSLYTYKDDVKATLAKLKRHDKIRIWGEISPDVNGPQKHIIVTNLVIEKESTALTPAFERKADFPASFPAQDVPFRALVHAVAKEQGLLVVEYKDAVLPVRVPEDITLPDLYKNDIVEMKAKVSSHPGSPKHLKLLEITVKDAIVNVHGKEIEKEGALIKFPKSGIIRKNIYAIQENLPDGLSRQYTVIAEESELFESARQKLEDLWEAADQTNVYNGRNKLVNPDLIVKVKGIGNEVDRGQANAQIIVSKVDDITATNIKTKQLTLKSKKKINKKKK